MDFRCASISLFQVVSIVSEYAFQIWRRGGGGGQIIEILHIGGPVYHDSKGSTEGFFIFADLTNIQIS